MFDTHRCFRRILAVGVGVTLLGAAPALGFFDDDEWYETSPYYEEDAWWDVTEWFDGNDYHPVDESWWEWDDETYERHDEYGYATGNDDDWFYDYYDNDDWYTGYYDYDNNNTFDYEYTYYDVDGDKRYDAMYGYYDTDGDGLFDEVEYIWFNEYGKAAQSRTEQQAKQRNKDKQLQRTQKVSGAIATTKTVQVRGQKHQVVQLETEQGRTAIVDLGTTDRTKKLKLTEGRQLTAEGRRSKVGDKMVVMASRVTQDGNTVQLNRHGKTMKVKVQDTRTVQARGAKHTLAVVNKDGKQCLVDLGPTKSLRADIKKGDTITVQGVPVKAHDTTVLMATQIERDGKMVDIKRTKAS